MKVNSRTSAVTRCPHCAGRQLHRHGTTGAGEQRYRCVMCGRTCNRFTGSLHAYIRKRFAFSQFHAVMSRAWPVRKEAKQLQVAPSTVWRWRRDVIQLMARQRKSKRQRWQEDAVSWAHFLGDRRRFWGSIHEFDWMERRGFERVQRFKEHMRGRPGTMVYFVIGTRPDRRKPGEIAIEVGEGALVRPRIPKTFAKLGHGRMFWMCYGQWFSPVAYRRGSSNQYVYIKDPPKRFAPPHRIRPQKRVWEWLMSSELKKAGRIAGDLKALFCRWANRFCGVSLHYLRSYIAWFLEELTSGRLFIDDWIYPHLAGWRASY